MIIGGGNPDTTLVFMSSFLRFQVWTNSNGGLVFVIVRHKLLAVCRNALLAGPLGVDGSASFVGCIGAAAVRSALAMPCKGIMTRSWKFVLIVAFMHVSYHVRTALFQSHSTCCNHRIAHNLSN